MPRSPLIHARDYRSACIGFWGKDHVTGPPEHGGESEHVNTIGHGAARGRRPAGPHGFPSRSPVTTATLRLTVRKMQAVIVRSPAAVAALEMTEAIDEYPRGTGKTGGHADGGPQGPATPGAARRTRRFELAAETSRPSLESGEGGIRTPDTGLNPYNGLANRRLQPLGHLSGEVPSYPVRSRHAPPRPGRLDPATRARALIRPEPNARR